MVWHTIPSPGTSTTNRFSGDWSNKISNMFSNVDISDSVTINSNVVWTFPVDALSIVDTADSTKKIAFILTGITTANTRNITMPDEDILLGNGVEGNQSEFIPAKEFYQQGSVASERAALDVIAHLATNDVSYEGAAFDDTTEENIGFIWVPPTNWDKGVIQARFYWSNGAGLTTETVDWGIKARAFQDSSAMDASWGAEVTVTDTWLAQDDMHISDLSADITVGGTPADDNPVYFNIARKVATDNLTGDAVLLGVVIEYVWNRSTQA
jgi:hypothetical protein